MHATALSETDSRILLEDAKRFHDLQRDESRVLALLPLHRILDGEFPDAAKCLAQVDSSVPSSHIRLPTRQPECR